MKEKFKFTIASYWRKGGRMSGVITCWVPLEIQLIPGALYLLKEGIFIWNTQETYGIDKWSKTTEEEYNI